METRIFIKKNDKNIFLYGELSNYENFLQKEFGAVKDSNNSSWLISNQKLEQVKNWIEKSRKYKSINSNIFDQEILLKSNSKYKRFIFGCECRDNYICLKCRYACCEYAERIFCVCLYCYKCDKHVITRRCHGSHD